MIHYSYHLKDTEIYIVIYTVIYTALNLYSAILLEYFCAKTVNALNMTPQFNDIMILWH